MPHVGSEIEKNHEAIIGNRDLLRSFHEDLEATRRNLTDVYKRILDLKNVKAP